MKYLPEIIWLITWPLLMWISYLIISKIIKKYEQKGN